MYVWQSNIQWFCGTGFTLDRTGSKVCESNLNPARFKVCGYDADPDRNILDLVHRYLISKWVKENCSNLSTDVIPTLSIDNVFTLFNNVTIFVDDAVVTTVVNSKSLKWRMKVKLTWWLAGFPGAEDARVSFRVHDGVHRIFNGARQQFQLGPRCSRFWTHDTARLKLIDNRACDSNVQIYLIYSSVKAKKKHRTPSMQSVLCIYYK